MKRLFPFGQGLPQEDKDEAYRERPKGKLPFHSHILIHFYIYRYIYIYIFGKFLGFTWETKGEEILFMSYT